jgi:preprotein translocase subunit SecG
MENFVLVVHVLIASIMTVFILMQQGKGADAGASFGAGGSQTVFGSAGSASFLTKLTAGLALVFFVTSMTLAVYAKKQVSGATIIPAATETVPAKPANTDIPVSAAPAAAVTPTTTDIPAASPATETSNPAVNPVK